MTSFKNWFISFLVILNIFLWAVVTQSILRGLGLKRVIRVIERLLQALGGHGLQRFREKLFWDWHKALLIKAILAPRPYHSLPFAECKLKWLLGWHDGKYWVPFRPPHPLYWVLENVLHKVILLADNHTCLLPLRYPFLWSSKLSPISPLTFVPVIFLHIKYIPLSFPYQKKNRNNKAYNLTVS